MEFTRIINTLKDLLRSIEKNLECRLKDIIHRSPGTQYNLTKIDITRNMFLIFLDFSTYQFYWFQRIHSLSTIL